jgi:L-amino acid N-acyltransferase YncA
MRIRPATQSDHEGLWAILEPTIRAGETYALPRDMTQPEALRYWWSAGHHVFVAELDQRVVGTYYVRANQQGGGAHVANGAYMTASGCEGQGLGAAMCADSLVRAKGLGFLAMQFNLVVSTNTRAIALWERHGFTVVGRLPRAFDHPAQGLVDALVMHRFL